MTTREERTVTDLRERTHGAVLTPGEDGYEAARTVWNATVDRRPGVVVRASGAADVMAAVRAASERGLEVAVRGGGHNVAGKAVPEGGLMVDCSAMDSVRVDPDARTARVGPGATLGDLDHETAAHGLAVPAGFVSTTGVAGLTLGGGFGYLSRRWGLTVDSLRSVDLVTAAGELVTASEHDHPELFWGLRGGGGNFGVVTSFEFDLHELDPTVLAGPVVHRFEDAPRVLRAVSAAMREAPDEVTCLVTIRHAPPAEFVPESLHGELVLLLVPVYAGTPDDGRAALTPLRAGDPVADEVAPRAYTALQSTFDEANGPGARNYWKAHYLPALTDEAIDTLCEHAGRMTSPESAVGTMPLGGAVSRVPADATAYPHRDAAWVLNVMSRWRDPDEDDEHVGWARETFEAMVPHTTGGVYVNFMSGDEGRERVQAAYGDRTYRRLAALKAEWDPENVFHLNQNVEPAVPGGTEQD
jgi:FAD/FMN-containing dehydrogenase